MLPYAPLNAFSMTPNATLANLSSAFETLVPLPSRDACALECGLRYACRAFVFADDSCSLLSREPASLLPSPSSSVGVKTASRHSLGTEYGKDFATLFFQTNAVSPFSLQPLPVEGFGLEETESVVDSSLITSLYEWAYRDKLVSGDVPTDADALLIVYFGAQLHPFNGNFDPSLLVPNLEAAYLPPPSFFCTQASPATTTDPFDYCPSAARKSASDALAWMEEECANPNRAGVAANATHIVVGFGPTVQESEHVNFDATGTCALRVAPGKTPCGVLKLAWRYLYQTTVGRGNTLCEVLLGPSASCREAKVLVMGGFSQGGTVAPVYLTLLDWLFRTQTGKGLVEAGYDVRVRMWGAGKAGDAAFSDAYVEAFPGSTLAVSRVDDYALHRVRQPIPIRTTDLVYLDVDSILTLPAGWCRGKLETDCIVDTPFTAFLNQLLFPLHAFAHLATLVALGNYPAPEYEADPFPSSAAEFAVRSVSAIFRKRGWGEDGLYENGPCLTSAFRGYLGETMCAARIEADPEEPNGFSAVQEEEWARLYRWCERNIEHAVSDREKWEEACCFVPRP